MSGVLYLYCTGKARAQRNIWFVKQRSRSFSWRAGVERNDTQTHHLCVCHRTSLLLIVLLMYLVISYITAITDTKQPLEYATVSLIYDLIKRSLVLCNYALENKTADEKRQ